MCYIESMTAIINGLNLGPVMAEDLASIGVYSIEKLREMGLEEVYELLIERFPNRLNMNCLVSLYGAIHELDWRKVDQTTKKQLMNYNDKLKKIYK